MASRSTGVAFSSGCRRMLSAWVRAVKKYAFSGPLEAMYA